MVQSWLFGFIPEIKDRGKTGLDLYFSRFCDRSSYPIVAANLVRLLWNKDDVPPEVFVGLLQRFALIATPFIMPEQHPASGLWPDFGSEWESVKKFADMSAGAPHFQVKFYHFCYVRHPDLRERILKEVLHVAAPHEDLALELIENLSAFWMSLYFAHETVSAASVREICLKLTTRFQKFPCQQFERVVIETYCNLYRDSLSTFLSYIIKMGKQMLTQMKRMEVPTDGPRIKFSDGWLDDNIRAHNLRIENIESVVAWCEIELEHSLQNIPMPTENLSALLQSALRADTESITFLECLLLRGMDFSENQEKGHKDLIESLRPFELKSYLRSAPNAMHQVLLNLLVEFSVPIKDYPTFDFEHELVEAFCDILPNALRIEYLQTCKTDFVQVRAILEKRKEDIATLWPNDFIKQQRVSPGLHIKLVFGEWCDQRMKLESILDSKPKLPSSSKLIEVNSIEVANRSDTLSQRVVDPSNESGPLHTVAELANVLNLTTDAVRKQIKRSGKIQGVTIAPIRNGKGTNSPILIEDNTFKRIQMRSNRQTSQD
jgi:hypothetical protein